MKNAGLHAADWFVKWWLQIEHYGRINNGKGEKSKFAVDTVKAVNGRTIDGVGGGGAATVSTAGPGLVTMTI